MAQNPEKDYLEQLVAEGRVGIRPYHDAATTVLTTLDFEKLFKRIQHHLVPIFAMHERICNGYSGTMQNYGKSSHPNPSCVIHDAMRAANIKTSPISLTLSHTTFGSFRTTCRLENNEGLISVTEGMHPFDYAIEDVV
ncbi:hypothetical protein TIFTF001_003329 [Ficus carica]|uniref:Uncharacterized protein n=1 Tax=Ficus carica TaxID=3494 RepID=A0AA88CV87_FICCA|nr:hypothetical protein TIFTF001_003329 [Ficus carica]